jgi:hypothetical protein
MFPGEILGREIHYENAEPGSRDQPERESAQPSAREGGPHEHGSGRNRHADCFSRAGDAGRQFFFRKNVSRVRLLWKAISFVC